MGFEQLESSKHSNSQQQGSRNSWGTVSLGDVGYNMLVQLPVASAKTTAKQDGT
jgi:hypothetical protein